jgi:hypothetical protein
MLPATAIASGQLSETVALTLSIDSYLLWLLGIPRQGDSCELTTTILVVSAFEQSRRTDGGRAFDCWTY